VHSPPPVKLEPVTPVEFEPVTIRQNDQDTKRKKNEKKNKRKKNEKKKTYTNTVFDRPPTFFNNPPLSWFSAP
jgi:hypothetical protein